MATADPIAPLASTQPAVLGVIPLATIPAYRQTGCAVVTVEPVGRIPHRHYISLRRYAALREWTFTLAARRWQTAGAWLRGSITVSLWEARA
jgi:hypothetical protein